MLADHDQLYHCMQKYLVIGEAPDVTRQAFQQRSRWCKGHFQVFWSEECPLFDGRLNLFHRVAYSSTCASYLSTALSVPVLNLVPMLTILFGWFHRTERDHCNRHHSLLHHPPNALLLLPLLEPHEGVSLLWFWLTGIAIVQLVVL